jgi:phage terminase large subunit-like protein
MKKTFNEMSGQVIITMKIVMAENQQWIMIMVSKPMKMSSIIWRNNNNNENDINQ